MQAFASVVLVAAVASVALVCPVDATNRPIIGLLTVPNFLQFPGEQVCPTAAPHPKGDGKGDGKDDAERGLVRGWPTPCWQLTTAPPPPTQHQWHPHPHCRLHCPNSPGTLAQATTLPFPADCFVPEGYVKLLESGGSRVVPLPCTGPWDDFTALVASVNGFLFTGM